VKGEQPQSFGGAQIIGPAAQLGHERRQRGGVAGGQAVQAQGRGQQFAPVAGKIHRGQKGPGLGQRKGRNLDVLEQEQIGPHMAEIQRIGGANHQPYRLAEHQEAQEMCDPRRHPGNIVDYNRTSDPGQMRPEAMHSSR